jgi:preprotein translocase subunit SecE
MSLVILEKSTRFLRDVKAELIKVSWPSLDDVRGATIVVIIVVLIVSFFIGLVDLVITKIEDLLFLG